MTLRMRVLPRFPAKIFGSTGIKIVRPPGSADLQVSLDVSDIIRVPSVADNNKVFFIAWNSDLNTYSIMSFADTFAAVIDTEGFMLQSVYDPQEIGDDAFDRGNHTGEQAISTITGLATALDLRLRVDAAQSFDATQRSQGMGNLGFSAFFKTLVDDADASGVLGTLGFSAFVKTIIDDANGAAMFATMGATYTATSTSVDIKFPNGMILKAGLFSGAGTDPEITFPVAFPTRIIAPFATMLVAAASTTAYSISIGTRSASGMALYRRTISNGGTVAGTTEPFFWMALGD
ncbi:gp53-like domain-containing protein [Agrobacterium deltaense]